jgi:biopolymer transport protein ExbD
MTLKLPEATEEFSPEPNVVPMIDILLVLLIIFMMQIPLSRQAMDVQVPAEEKVKKQQQNEKSNQIVLELREDGSYAVNTQPLPKQALDAKFHEVYDERPAKLLFIKVGNNRKYQEVIEAMDIARGAGVQVIGFVPPEEKKPPAD